MAESNTKNNAPRPRQTSADALRIWQEQLGKFGIPPAGDDWEGGGQEYLTCRCYRTSRGSKMELRLYRQHDGFQLFANMVSGTHCYEDLRMLAEQLQAAGLDIENIEVQGVYKRTPELEQQIDAYAEGYKKRLKEAGGDTVA